MSSRRLRIIISLAVAFLVVNFYGRLTTSPFISPIQAENIRGLLANLKFNPSSLTRLFTLNFKSKPICTGQACLTPTVVNNNNSLTLPTVSVKPINSNDFPPSLAPSGRPTATSGVANGPTQRPTPTVFSTGLINQTPTSKPPKPPKPTATPKPVAVTSAQRPGSTLSEIFNEVSKRECIPAALIYAFQTQETGPWWPINTVSSKVKIYNKYGWWLDGTGSSCTGMGYHTQTGIVPSDAYDAGTVCQNALGGYDQGIMGILQISQEEQDAAKKYMTDVIKGSIDRRVLFDNAVIFAIITKNRLSTPPSNCNDWPDDAIREAAEKHYGSCGDNYCTNILKYYKQYK